MTMLPPLYQRPPGAEIPATSKITPDSLDRVLNTKGQANNGMYKAVFGRSARMHGKEVGNQMGVNTWAAFAGSDEDAVVDGDFVCREEELQATLKSVRKAGINVVLEGMAAARPVVLRRSEPRRCAARPPVGHRFAAEPPSRPAAPAGQE